MRVEIPEGYEARIADNEVIIEPKDERIIKALLRCCDDWEKGQFGCMKAEDIPEIRAYLEKQKAKERYDRMAPVYADVKSFEEALDKAWKFYNDSGCFTVDGCEDNFIELAFTKGFREGFLYKKQKEPHSTKRNALFDKCVRNCDPAIMKEVSDNIDKMCQKTFEETTKEIIKDKESAIKFLKSAGIVNENGELSEMYRSEQKPAEGSEEDEKIAKSLAFYLEADKGNFSCNGFTKAEFINFLKALPERFNLQSKQEWSETDKLHLNNAILIAKKEWGVNSYTARFLETLRDNYKKCNSQWKPSKEQMEALKASYSVLKTHDTWGEDEHLPLLLHLYNDLKKL